MNYKLLTATISLLCVLMMMGMTFQPAAASRGADGSVIQSDMTIDMNGNKHQVYSQLVRYYVTIGNAQVPKWQAEVFYKNNVGLNRGWNAPIQISDTMADSSWPQVSVDSSTGIIYVSWIEEGFRDNKFWYAGSDNGGESFTAQRYGAAAPWPVAPNLDMAASQGILTFTWRPSGTLELVADIDGDMIPDFHDAQPMVYNTDNFAIQINPDVVATDNDLGVTIAIDYDGEDDTFPTVTSATGDFAVSTGDYIEINLETDADFSAIIKMQYSDVPPALTADYLRFYRQVGDNWVVVTDWELEEFTGINIEHGFAWAYVKRFSTFTLADASQVDGDGDGLVDLTEDTEPSSTTQFTLSGNNFYRRNVNTLPEVTQPEIPPNAIYITNVIELQNMNNNLDGYYVLANDIDASATSTWNNGEGFVPIGTSKNRFTGRFDGQGFTITGLCINIPNSDYVGLFGYIDTNGEARNVKLIGTDVTGNSIVGGLVGMNKGTVFSAHVTGKVHGAGMYVGGLIGYNIYYVSQSFYSGSVIGGLTVGGLVGLNYHGTISKSHVGGSVSGIGGTYYVGGLLGHNEGAGAIVSYSYATADVSGDENQRVGGLVGYHEGGTIGYSLATGKVTAAVSTLGGGLVGQTTQSWSISNSYYDRETTGQSDTGKGIPKTTTEMKTLSTFTNWDFSDTYWMIEGVTYPRFQWSYPDNSVSHFLFNIDPYNTYLAVAGYLEISSNSAQPIEDLNLDIGNDGTIDWRAPTDFDGTLRFGTIRHAISDYLFKNYLNTDAKLAEIPFKFSSSNAGEIYITHAKIVIEDVTTYNNQADTSGDGLVDGWYDQNGNFVYEREGVDGQLGTENDEIPGALAHNLDPREMNVIGSSGRVAWNEFQEGINQVNGNLALISQDIAFTTLGHTMMVERTYNSLNSGNNGPFGYGWDFNYGERLGFIPYFVEYISGDGSSCLFEDLEDGTYATPQGYNTDLIFSEGVYKLRFTDGTVKYFSSTGRLEQIQDKNGNLLSMTYDIDGNLVRVQDGTGLFLDFAYTNGLITSITDPIPRTNTYVYQNGRLVSHIDAMDYEYRYEYDSTLGKLSVTINPLGMYKEYQYTSEFPHKATRCTVGEYDFDTVQKTPAFIEYDAVYAYPSHMSAFDANGQESMKIFDKYGVAIEVENPDGSKLTKEYDTKLNPIKEIDGKGGVWNNKFDPMGNQISQKDPSGNASSTQFLNKVTPEKYISLPTKTVDKNGAETTYTYDENDNPTAMTDAESNTAEFGFTTDGLLQSQTQPNGATTSYTYDIYGNVVTETDALESTITYYYDNINRKTGMLDARNGLTQYVYDDLGRTTMIIDPLGNEEINIYDALGNALSFTDRVGGTTTYEYDVFGRKISETNALGNASYFDYDWKGNMIRETDMRGNSTYYVYDEMDRLVSVIDALGYYENYTYDANGNQLERIDKLGNVWYNYYDELGRVTHEFCPYHVAIRYEYDAEGRVTKRIDRLGYETIYEYDARGNKVRELGAEGSDTRYAYDEAGHLISVSQIDGVLNSTVWHYEYDLLGRKTGETTPLGFTYFWAYDEVGNLIEYTDANGQNTTYGYDALNRLTNLTMPGEHTVDITYQITENERQEYNYPIRYIIYVWPPRPQMPVPPRLSMMDKEFDLLGRLTKETWVFIDGNVTSDEFSISYGYDANGNVIEMTDQFGLVTTYVYDEMNRLVALTDPDGDTTTYQYDALGQLILTTYPIGTRIYQEYNAANLLTGIWNIRSNDTIISSFQYGYNFNANRVSVTEAGGATTSYAYDKENRLTQVTYPDNTQTQYQYDRRNNMASTTTITETATETTAMTYDIENRLLQSGDKTFEYDSNGNQVEGDTYYGYYSTFLDGYKVKWLGSVGTVGTGPDPTPTSADGDGIMSESTPATTYGYALDGRRVGKAGHVDMKYLYDGENVVYELWDHMTVRFTHPVVSGGGCGSGACGAGSCDIFFTDHPISITIYDENGIATKYYYLYDGLGSVTELIDEGGNVVNAYRYTPFGDALIREETVYNPYQFTGRQYDAESGLYHYRARAYSADIGRFMQQDPAGMVDGANMYAYVGNNPVNGVDPSGLATFNWKTYRSWRITWYYGWKLKFTPAETGWISTGTAIAALITLKTVVLSVVLAIISLATSICANLKLGLVIDYYHIPFVYPTLGGIRTYWCEK